ncbi:glycosyltransferase [Streptococcus cristatus]|nr:glycosyltransferase [Streptococcus cristatus]
MMIKFSVLMSVYRKEEPGYLSDSLESILVNQTCRPDELILVKDGPLTDELESVIERYQSLFSKIKIVTLETNQGLGIALKEGLEYCTYDWVARMDTDDIAKPNRFEEQIAYLKKHPDIDVLGSAVTEIYSEIEDVASEKRMPLTNEDILSYMKTRNPFCHMTIFFKKSSVQKAGSYQPLPLVEDYYLWVRMAAQGCRFANLSQSLVYARIGNGMHVRRSQPAQITSWKVVNDFMLKERMINIKEWLKNLLLISAFVYMPLSLKKRVYKKVLRK